MTTLLVTGGAGMVAQHVAEAAARRGLRVRLADYCWRDRYRWADATEQITFDIRDKEACKSAAIGVDAIVHCAAVVGPKPARHDPLVSLDVNVRGTANLLEAAHAARARMINLSTATLYGHRPDLAPLDEADRPEPLGMYDGTKLMAETYCTVHRKTYGSDVASIRTGFVFGRGTTIGEYFLPRVLRGEAVHEPAGRDHPCDFTYVVDLAEALVAATLADELPEPVYNVTGGQLRNRGELAAAVGALLPGAEILQGPGVDPGRHLRGACRIERARRDFGWSPRFDIESGLADWLHRLREEG